MSNNFFLISNPPPKPTNEPLAPTTLCHGIIIDIGFLLFALPTALAAFGL